MGNSHATAASHNPIPKLPRCVLRRLKCCSGRPPQPPDAAYQSTLHFFFLSVGTIAKSQGDWNRSCSAPIKIAGPRGWSALVHSLLPLLLFEWETTGPQGAKLEPYGPWPFQKSVPCIFDTNWVVNSWSTRSADSLLKLVPSCQ
jgi:hypothetical protein